MSLSRTEKDIPGELQGVTLKNLPGIQIASGTHGKVFKAMLLSGNEYAVKQMADNFYNQREIENIDFLMDNPSPYVVTYFRYEVCNQNIYVGMEYIETNLFQVITKSLSEETQYKLMSGVTNAIHFLHGKNIIHRDIKPENFLVDKEGNVKICDFGFASFKDSSHQKLQLVGTFKFCAPEVFERKGHTLASDIYSTAMTFWAIKMGKLPFANKTNTEVCFHVADLKKREVIPENWPERLIKLTKACWSADPDDRPLIQEVKNEIELILTSVQNR